MAKELTHRAVAALKPGPRREVPDGRVGGLYCLVAARGPASWTLRYRQPGTGKPRKLTLGRIYLGDDPPEPILGGPLSLAGARKVALEARALIDLGRDPAAEKRDAAAERRAALRHSFGDLVGDYFETAVPLRRRNRTAATGRKLIEGNCAAWLDRPARSITRHDVRRLLDDVVKRGSPIMANRLRDMLSPVFAWALRRELIDENPVAAVDRPAEERARDRTLSDDELVEVWRAAETLDAPWAPLAQVLILTGQRLGAAEAMRWSDLHDLDGAAPEWRIPPEHQKMGAEHVVALAPAVVAIVREQAEARQRLVEATEDEARRALIASVPYVFWGGRVGRRGEITRLSGRSRFRERWRAAAGSMPDWRPHDLRRTLASGLARLGVPLHVSEMILDHRPRALRGVAAVYQRYDFAAEQRQALALWADHVARLVDGRPAADNVVALRK